MQAIAAHAARVHAVAFSPDGSLLATAGKDGMAKLWHLASGQSFTLAGHADAVLSVAFHPTAPYLATGSADGSAKLWSLDDGSCVRDLPADGEPVCTLAFLAEGRLLAAGTGERANAAKPGTLRVWDTAKPQPIKKLGEPNGVWAVAVLPAGKTLVWGGGDKRCHRWDLTAPDRFHFPPQQKGVRALALSADGKTLAVADDWTVKLWDAETRQERATLAGHKGMVDALAFAPDGRTLVSGGWDKLVKVWDAAAGRERASYDWGVGMVRAVAVSADGALAAAAGDTGHAVVWDAG